jgi:excisionase family DNA binding protein
LKRLQDYYSVEAASAATGIKYKTLLQRIARGKLKHEEFGRIKLIPTDEVERLKKERASC